MNIKILRPIVLTGLAVLITAYLASCSTLTYIGSSAHKEAEPAPVTRAEPMEKPIPVIHATPVTRPEPIEKPVPVIHATPVTRPEPMEKPIPVPMTRAMPVPAAIERSTIFEPAPVSASKPPSYAYRLTNPEIWRNHEEVLSVAVSPTLNQDKLSEFLIKYQQELQAVHSKANSGSLQTSHWTKFKFIQAKIQCPSFLKCEGDSHPKSTADDAPLIWNWNLKGTQWDATQSGSISVDFFGGQKRSDKFDEKIVTLPPLQISIKVNRDLIWWENLINQVKRLLISIQGLLEVLAALWAIVFSWFKWNASRKPK